MLMMLLQIWIIVNHASVNYKMKERLRKNINKKVATARLDIKSTIPGCFSNEKILIPRKF